MDRKTVIEAKEIHAGYGKRKVLFDVSFKIPDGTTTLLIGPNGSGKSTLIKVITGILKPEKGKVFYKGKDITDYPIEKRIHMGIGYLRQARNIFTMLTVRENLELAGYGTKKEDLSERIEKVLSYFPFLENKLNIRAGLLSGGERQALAIGMVLMCKKEVLLLDEPTAGLAPSAAKQILESIEKIKSDENVTILMVEHNLKLVASWADRVIALREGRVVGEEEKLEEFLKNHTKLEQLFFG